MKKLAWIPHCLWVVAVWIAGWRDAGDDDDACEVDDGVPAHSADDEVSQNWQCQ
jgi:hypothetical protein